HADLAELRRHDATLHHPQTDVEGARSPVIDPHARTVTLVEAADGAERLAVHSNCLQLLQQFRTWDRVKGLLEVDKHEEGVLSLAFATLQQGVERKELLVAGTVHTEATF